MGFDSVSELQDDLFLTPFYHARCLSIGRSETRPASHNTSISEFLDCLSSIAPQPAPCPAHFQTQRARSTSLALALALQTTRVLAAPLWPPLSPVPPNYLPTRPGPLLPVQRRLNIHTRRVVNQPSSFCPFILSVSFRVLPGCPTPNGQREYRRSRASHPFRRILAAAFVDRPSYTEASLQIRAAQPDSGSFAVNSVFTVEAVVALPAG